MKSRKTLIGTMIVALVVAGGFGLAWAHMGSDYSGTGGYGPMGSYGQMGDLGHMGSGAKGEGQPCGGADVESAVQINKEEAKGMISFQLRRSNPNLKVGKIAEKEEGFEVTIVTKDNSLVDRIMVEKNTGRIYRVTE
ncbi:MAG: hypothetical protein ACC669_01430 [bacterium]